MVGVWLFVFIQSAAAQTINVEWFEAARMGDTESLKRQLAAGANINQVDYSKRAALNHALATGRIETARFLVERGADLKQPGDYLLPLNWAVLAGDTSLVRLMLEKGANPRATVETALGTRSDLLDDTVRWGRVDMLRLLESKGYAVPPAMYSTSVNWAARFGQVDAMQFYLGKGGSANDLFRDNLALDVAAFYGDMSVVEALLKAGAQPNRLSTGAPQPRDWQAYKRTPLMTAVLADEREAVARLLKAGADARAQGDAALVWADLVGDEQIYRMLRTAGAKEPAAFAFADWLGKGYEYNHEETERRRTSAGEATVAELSKLGALRAERTTSEPLPAGTKVAIVMAGEGLSDAEALLSAKATALPGAVVLERTEIKRVLAERKLIEMLGKPGGEAEAGRVLGADILVILKSHVMEKTKWREARVVAVRTGVVAGTAYAGEKDPVDAWTDEVIGHCGAAGDVLRVGEGKFRLVAVPRVVASLNTMEARELERRLTLVLAARIGRLPGVLIAEREALDRLAVEQGAAGAAYATSTWIMEATLEVPLGEGGELRLVVSLRNGAAGKTEQLVVTSPRSNDTTVLMEQAVMKIASALGAPVEGQWTQEAEAAAFLAKTKRYAGIFLWAEASAAAESAWALGLRTDEVARLRLKTAVMRILAMQRLVLPQKRERKNYYGVAEFVALRAPLLMPVEDARELSLDEQLDLANRALDIYAASLPGLGGTFGGEPGSRWLCGEVWDAATLPLRYTEPLSYGRTHGTELAALRERLLGLHAEALAMARKRRNALEVQTLTGIGIKHLAWWQPDETVFRGTIRKTLKDSIAWTPPLSEQSAWVNAWRVAAPCMGATTGRAAQAWVRLAREMAVSADNREAFFGLALEAIETPNVRRRVEIMQQLRDRIPALNDADRGINTLVYAIAHEAVPSDPFLEKAMRPWYMEAFSEVRRINGHNSDIHTGWPQDGNFDMTGRNGGTYPEVRAFNVEQVLRRLETIKRSGPGGMMEFSFAEKYGYKAEEVALVGRLQAEVAPVFQQLAAREPQAAYASDSIASKVRHIGMVDRTYGMGQSIASGKVRNPFVERYAQLTDIIKTRWSFRMTGYPVPRPHGWYFAKVVAGYAYGVIAPGGVDEVLAFQMDAAGEPKNVRRVLQGFMMNYDGRQDVEPQVSDRWMVIPGEKRRKDDEEVPADKPREVVAVLDMRNPAAAPRYFPLAGSQAALRSLRLAGDRIIYSFVYNPTFSRGGGSQEMEQKGDPAFGIAEIDILTGKETLLASSRRQPAEAPVESEGLKVFRAISLIGETAFTVAGESKQSKHVFDLVTREWREMTPEDRKLAQADKTALPGEWGILIEGTWMPLQRMTQENNLRFYGGRSLGFIDIAVNFDYGNLETTHKVWVQALKDAVKITGEGYKYIYPMQDGLYVTLANGFYYWLPMETVRARLTEAVVAKRAAIQAKAAEEKPKTE